MTGPQNGLVARCGHAQHDRLRAGEGCGAAAARHAEVQRVAGRAAAGLVSEAGAAAHDEAAQVGETVDGGRGSGAQHTLRNRERGRLLQQCAG